NSVEPAVSRRSNFDTLYPRTDQSYATAAAITSFARGLRKKRRQFEDAHTAILCFSSRGSDLAAGRRPGRRAAPHRASAFWTIGFQTFSAELFHERGAVAKSEKHHRKWIWPSTTLRPCRGVAVPRCAKLVARPCGGRS